MSTAQQPDAYALAVASAIQQGFERAYAKAGWPTAAATGSRPDFRTPPYGNAEVTLLVMRLFRAHLMPLAKRVSELERQLGELQK